MNTRQSALQPDFATLAGLLLSIGGIIAGLLLEGGRIADVTQITAALVVVGGTLGAVLVTTPGPVLWRAVQQLRFVFVKRVRAEQEMIGEILLYAAKARKHGLIALESDVERVSDPFLGKALSLAVDGAGLRDLRETMQLELLVEERRAEAAAKVYESAGGYAPTIGIIGAVLGLIQVMKHLDNMTEVGRGIAVAFVATVYGVGLANLLLLPAAGKLRANLQQESLLRELMLEGVISIVEGMNPHLLRSKLEAFVERGAAAAPIAVRESSKMRETAAVEG